MSEVLMETLFNDKMTEKMTEIILQAFKRGNTVELKKEQDKIVVVELQRKARVKASISR